MFCVLIEADKKPHQHSAPRDLLPCAVYLNRVVDAEFLNLRSPGGFRASRLCRTSC